MPKRSCGWAKRPVSDTILISLKWYLIPALITLTGCATPQYALRSTPVPEESASALQIERSISAIQAKEFGQQGAHPIRSDETLVGFKVQSIIDRLSRVTERPNLHYRGYLYLDQDPNAAALADGRVYISTGLLNYLGSRGSRADELAFILGHELAHTVAQHLVKRYRLLQQRQLLIGLVAAGASAATRGGSAGVQQAGRLVVDVASLLNDVSLSGYSQEHELEADQLGIEYVIRAGLDPRAALDLLQDFARFDNPWPILRTHPYILRRREDLARYLAQRGTPPHQPTTMPPASTANTQVRVRELRKIQQMYPEGSVSRRNLQRQIDALERNPERW